MRTSPRSLILLWALAVLGFPIGGYLGHLVAWPAATVPAAMLLGLIAGAIIGLGQGLALRLHVRELAMWASLTGVGLAVAPSSRSPTSLGRCGSSRSACFLII